MILVSRVLAGVAVFILLMSAWSVYRTSDYMFLGVEYMFLEEGAADQQSAQQAGGNDVEAYARLSMIGMSLKVSAFYVSVAFVLLSVAVYADRVSVSANVSPASAENGFSLWLCVAGLAGAAGILSALALG